MMRQLMIGFFLALTAGAASAETIVARSDECMAADVAYESNADADAPVDLNAWRAEFDFRHAHVAVPIDGRFARRGPRLFIPVDLEGDPKGVGAGEDCAD